MPSIPDCIHYLYSLDPLLMFCRHEQLQDTAIENLLSLSEISADFSAPASFNTIATIAGLLSSSLFLIGGVAGLGSSIGGFLGAGVASRVAIDKRILDLPNIDAYTRIQTQARIGEDQARADSIASANRQVGALSAVPYLSTSAEIRHWRSGPAMQH